MRPAASHVRINIKDIDEAGPDAQDSEGQGNEKELVLEDVQRSPEPLRRNKVLCSLLLYGIIQYMGDTNGNPETIANASGKLSKESKIPLQLLTLKITSCACSGPLTEKDIFIHILNRHLLN